MDPLPREGPLVDATPCPLLAPSLELRLFSYQASIELVSMELDAPRRKADQTRRNKSASMLFSGHSTGIEF